MIRFFITTCLLLSVLLVFSQSSDTVQKYLNEKLQLTSKDKMVYKAFAIKEETHWYLTAVSPNNDSLLKIYFTNESLTIHDGPHILYYTNNIKSEEIFFHNNIADGKYQSWYENKILKDSGMYNNGRQNGLCKSWYETGQLKSSGYYKNDTLEGEWNWYRKNGKLSSREVYKKNKLVKLECYDENGQYTGDNCGVARLPTAIGNFGNLNVYLQSQITWNSEMIKHYKEPAATVIVKFTITEKGDLKNFTIVESPDSSFSLEATRLFQLIKKWSPAVVHNQVKDYTMEYILSFSLD